MLDFDNQWDGAPAKPFPGGPPDPVPQIDTTLETYQDAYWFALGKPKTQRVYISTQGDWWDMIAMNVYGKKRGNEHLMFRLIEANYHLRDISHFPAGIAVVVPQVDVVTTIPLVPWKNAVVTPPTP
jgi:phage tail protein X